MKNRDIRGRSPLSSIPGPALQRIQTGTMKYTWAGVICSKDPFDLALYPLLIWNLKPATIIEIGTKEGGSALWLSDLLYRFDLRESTIISVDINQRAEVRRKNIKFLSGDGRDLGATLSNDMMTNLPRPLLVLEDADHHYLTTLAVLRFMNLWMTTGDYIVIEDGISDSLPRSHLERNEGGPNRAIEEFLSSPEGRSFEIDSFYCDFFGQNATWNTNGYLRRA